MFSFLAAASRAEREENSERGKQNSRKAAPLKQTANSSCRVREPKRDNAHANSYRRGSRVAGTQPLGCPNSRHICFFICIPAVRALNGRVLVSISPKDTLIFHTDEGVGTQSSLPAADWGETGKQADSGGSDGVRGWILLHVRLWLKQSFHCFIVIRLGCWRFNFLFLFLVLLAVN